MMQQIRYAQMYMPSVPGFWRKRLLQRSKQSECSSFKASGGNCSSVDVKMFWKSCNTKMTSVGKKNHKELSYVLLFIFKMNRSKGGLFKTCNWLFPSNGGLPVTSWNNIAPTLHKSACNYKTNLNFFTKEKWNNKYLQVQSNLSSKFHHLGIIFLVLNYLWSHVQWWTT